MQKKQAIATNKISLSEAIKQLSAYKGISRRKAERILLKHLKSGELRAYGTLVNNAGGQMVTSGRQEQIDSEFWNVNKAWKKNKRGPV